jgi:hypothetical protein
VGIFQLRFIEFRHIVWHLKNQKEHNVGLREKMNENPKIATGATIGIVGIALILIVWQLMGLHNPTGAITNSKYFTTDDGKSYFKDSDDKIAPFDKDGKTAYEAYVVSCDGGKTPYVAALLKYTENYKKVFNGTVGGGSISGTGILYRTPLTPDDPKNWYPRENPKGALLANPTCPDGTLAGPVVP